MIGGEMRAQAVAFVATHDIEMIDVGALRARGRQSERQAGKSPVVSAGDGRTSNVVGVKLVPNG